MENIIKLSNRYKRKNYLFRVGAHTWVLHEDNSDFTRVICSEGKKWEDKDYYAIDPDGGPFICVGSKIDDEEIIKITESDEYDEGKYVFITK